MKKVIDINDIKTYPSEFVNFIKQEETTLNNTFKGNMGYMCCDCYLFEHINNMFNGYYFKCIQASRVNNINDIYNKKILLPFNFNELVNIILKPIKNQLGQEYKNVEKKLRGNIKYQTLHYVIGDTDDITISNGLLMLDKYGGELLEDNISYDEPNLYNKIVNFCKPIAILFGLDNKQIRLKFLVDLYSSMLGKVLYSTRNHFFRESWIYDSVRSDEIIEVKGLVNYE